jgi:sugar lactone lactonase YvrE
MTEVHLLDKALPPCQLGEGAYWDQSTNSLYWVDITGRRVHRYSTTDRTHSNWLVSKEVSFAYPNDGRLVLCLSDGIYDFDPVTRSEEPIALLDLPAHHRLNDGKMDPQGRLWVGTINTSNDPSDTAALYLLNDDVLEEVESGYVNANGKAWSPDGQIMYHADTARSTIWEYDYDLQAGTISNKRVFRKVDGNPDGLTVDRRGNVCAAIYGGSRIDIFSHRGDLVESIGLPVPNPTSCAWGGVDAKTLFVTSAFDGMTAEQRADAPQSGMVFAVLFEQ